MRKTSGTSNHAKCESAGIDLDALAARLQEEAAKSFANSWNALMDVIAAKSASLKKAS
jgi:transaldolase